MCAMSIGEFAKAVGVSVETIRFYERRGLLAPERRKANGYRVFGPDAVRRMRLIRTAKAFTFTLRELKENAGTLGRVTECNAALRDAAHTKLGELDREIARLQKVRRSLNATLRRCGRTKRCPCFTQLDRMCAGSAKNDSLVAE